MDSLLFETQSSDTNNMTNTEVPAGNQETAKSGKGTRAAKCERIWLIILIVVVVLGAIAGIATTLVLLPCQSL